MHSIYGYRVVDIEEIKSTTSERAANSIERCDEFKFSTNEWNIESLDWGVLNNQRIES